MYCILQWYERRDPITWSALMPEEEAGQCGIGFVAAKRRKNTAHGASRGWETGDDTALKGRKNEIGVREMHPRAAALAPASC